MLEVLAGGATGLLGSVVKRLFGFAEEWQKRKTMALEFEHELKLQEMNMKIRAQETESELLIAEQQYDAEQLQASYVHDTGTGTASQWVIDTLRMVRPALTLLTVLLAAIVFLLVRDDDPMMVTFVVESIMYLASLTVSWWFGDRGVNFIKR